MSAPQRGGRINFGIKFDIAADPNVALGPYYTVAAFPMNMVIRTSNMRIHWQHNGYAPGAVEKQIDQLLAVP